MISCKFVSGCLFDCSEIGLFWQELEKVLNEYRYPYTKYIDIQKAMFCGKAAKDYIGRVHKRALRILLDDHESTFEALLAKNCETNIHTQNLCMLMIEIYKTLNNANLPFMQSILQGNTSNMTSGLEICYKFLLQKALHLALAP